MQADRGFAFVKLDTHEHAAMAICQLQGVTVQGRPIKCSWGKDRADGTTAQPAAISPTPAAAPVSPYANMVRSHRLTLSLSWLTSTFEANVRDATAQYLWPIRLRIWRVP
jgi:RNA recognition motif-containing protein